MSDIAQSESRRRSTALIVSICLNVALVAMILAAAASVFLHRAHWQGGPLGIHAMMEIAAPAERARIEDIVQRHRPRLQDLADHAKAARLAAYKVFAEPTFDRASYVRALDQMRLQNDALQAEVSAMMAEAAQQLSPDERERLAVRAGRRSWWSEGRHRHSFW